MLLVSPPGCSFDLGKTSDAVTALHHLPINYVKGEDYVTPLVVAKFLPSNSVIQTSGL